MKRKILKALVCMILILSCAVAPVAAVAASNAAYILNVSTDYARMRGGVNNAEIVGTLRAGTKVLYGGENLGQLCKVYTSNGVSGYVYRDYLSLYGAVRKSNICITTSATPFYTREGSSLERRGTVGKGNFVLVYKVNGNWCYVKSLTGVGGYMKTDALWKIF